MIWWATDLCARSVQWVAHSDLWWAKHLCVRNVQWVAHIDVWWANSFRRWFDEQLILTFDERWGAGVETQKNVRGEVGGWGRVPFNEPYAPSLSTTYDGAQGSLNSWKWYSTPAPHLSLWWATRFGDHLMSYSSVSQICPVSCSTWYLMSNSIQRWFDGTTNVCVRSVQWVAHIGFWWATRCGDHLMSKKSVNLSVGQICPMSCSTWNLMCNSLRQWFDERLICVSDMSCELLISIAQVSCSSNVKGASDVFWVAKDKRRTKTHRTHKSIWINESSSEP